MPNRTLSLNSLPTCFHLNDARLCCNSSLWRKQGTKWTSLNPQILQQQYKHAPNFNNKNPLRVRLGTLISRNKILLCMTAKKSVPKSVPLHTFSLLCLRESHLLVDSGSWFSSYRLTTEWVFPTPPSWINQPHISALNRLSKESE